MTTPQKGRIFISYRRADSAGYAGRIYDRLTAHFGKDAVFMDVDVIPAGVDFVETLQKAVQSCDVLVALIGQRWLNIKDETGKRRLDNPEDFVRIEVAAALERDIRVIPVLVDGAIMPRSTELPNNLMALARRNALQVNHHSFNSDAQRLISQLELALKAAEDLEKHIAAMSAELEKEKRERREAEEKARIEKEAREKAGAEERARLAVEQKAEKEREEREQKQAEEKARKIALRKARQQETAERIKNVFGGRRELPFFIGGAVVILFLLGYILTSSLFPSTPALPPEKTTTLALPSVTSTEPPTRILFTSTPTSIDLPTKILPIPTPTPSVGSTMISEKDGMNMMYVPAGEFQMGSEDGDSDEKPVHNVFLSSFWIDQTEVTNEMFAAFLNAEENQIEDGKTWFNGTGSDVRIRKADIWQAITGYEDHPVVNVTWYGARAYCRWVERRLPTEAEWEKAAGWDADAQVHRFYPWGDSIDENYANYSQKIGGTTEVGSYVKGASFYGAYDMAGNVWEWVFDTYVKDYYSMSPFNNPVGFPDDEDNVRRGGSWYHDMLDLRTFTRNGSYPWDSNNTLGFRCASAFP